MPHVTPWATVPMLTLGAAALGLFGWALPLTAAWVVGVAMLGACAHLASRPRFGLLEGAAVLAVLHAVVAAAAIRATALEASLELQPSPEALGRAIEVTLSEKATALFVAMVLAAGVALGLVTRGRRKPERVVIAALLATSAAFLVPGGVPLWREVLAGELRLTLAAIAVTFVVWGFSMRADAVHAGVARLLGGVAMGCAALLDGMSRLVFHPYTSTAHASERHAELLVEILTHARDTAAVGVSLGVALMVGALLAIARMRRAPRAAQRVTPCVALALALPLAVGLLHRADASVCRVAVRSSLRDRRFERVALASLDGDKGEAGGRLMQVRLRPPGLTHDEPVTRVAWDGDTPIGKLVPTLRALRGEVIALYASQP